MATVDIHGSGQRYGNLALEGPAPIQALDGDDEIEVDDPRATVGLVERALPEA